MAATPVYAIVATTTQSITLPEGTNTDVNSGYVLNKIVWDGVSALIFPEGSEAILDSDDLYQIGDVIAPESAPES